MQAEQEVLVPAIPETLPPSQAAVYLAIGVIGIVFLQHLLDKTKGEGGMDSVTVAVPDAPEPDIWIGQQQHIAPTKVLKIAYRRNTKDVICVKSC